MKLITRVATFVIIFTPALRGFNAAAALSPLSPLDSLSSTIDGQEGCAEDLPDFRTALKTQQERLIAKRAELADLAKRNSQIPDIKMADWPNYTLLMTVLLSPQSKRYAQLDYFLIKNDYPPFRVTDIKIAEDAKSLSGYLSASRQEEADARLALDDAQKYLEAAAAETDFLSMCWSLGKAKAALDGFYVGEYVDAAEIFGKSVQRQVNIFDEFFGS